MRRSYSGNARATTLSGGISAAATSFTVADGTGYPTGAAGPFVVTLDAGNAAEEKVLCTSRTGNTMAVTSRGWDGTTASDHDNAASVQHTISATDLDEANALVSGGGTITAPSAAVIPLVVKGAAAQAANLLEARDSAGTLLASVSASGRTGIGPGSDGFSTYCELGVIADLPGARGLVVRGAASQTANLAEFQNSAGTVVTAIRAAGSFEFGAGTGFSSSSATAGDIASLPATVSGYLSIYFGGIERKIPYYNP